MLRTSVPLLSELHSSDGEVKCIYLVQSVGLLLPGMFIGSARIRFGM